MTHDQLTSKSQFITHLIGKLLNGLELETTGIDTKSYELLLQIKRIVGNDSDDLFTGLYCYNKFSALQLKRLTTIVDQVNENLLAQNKKMKL